MEHRFLGVDSRREGHTAACSCGWTSPTVGTAGLAGSAWDEHASGNGDDRRPNAAK